MHDLDMTGRFSNFHHWKWWLLANAAGAALYLWLASWTWIEPQLRGENPARSGDAFRWAITALPVLLAFAVANFVWGWRRHGAERTNYAELLIVALWALAVCADRLLS